MTNKLSDETARELLDALEAMADIVVKQEARRIFQDSIGSGYGPVETFLELIDRRVYTPIRKAKAELEGE